MRKIKLSCGHCGKVCGSVEPDDNPASARGAMIVYIDVEPRDQAGAGDPDWAERATERQQGSRCRHCGWKLTVTMAAFEPGQRNRVLPAEPFRRNE